MPSRALILKTMPVRPFAASFVIIYASAEKLTFVTDWSLLRKVSQKRLHLALQNQGLSDREIASYILAWQAYKLVYVPAQETGSRQLAAPDLSTWEAISAQYNRERHCLSAPANTLIAKQAETWMVAAAKAVRSYLYPSAVSMNATRPGQDAGEFIDSFTDDDQVSPLGELMAEEAYSFAAAAIHSARRYTGGNCCPARTRCPKADCTVLR